MADISLPDAIAWYVLFVFSTVCHEGAHAFAAWRLGDPTAHDRGQVTLDPLPHLRREPFGMVIIPLVTLLSGAGMIGWGSTPYDARWAAAYPRRAGLMALAGPAANLGLVLLAALAVRGGIALGGFLRPEQILYSGVVGAVGEGFQQGAAKAVSILFTLNLLLFAFNLIPLPPMDGSGALAAFLPAGLSARLRAVMNRPFTRFVGILVAWNVFPSLFGPFYHFALDLLYWGSRYR
jgi:Zn-dependent protease